MLKYIMNFFGGLAVFILGVRLLSDNAEKLLLGRMNFLLKKFARTPYSSFMTGTTISAVTQSSVAVNSALVKLVDSDKISLLNACAVIVGVNVGTTMTTQIISFANMSLDMSIIGCLICFIGVLLSSFKRFKCGGLALTGFGFIFMGIKMISPCAEYFQRYSFFMKIFTVENPFLLIFYGVTFPAILQSSSPLTAIMVVLSEQGVLSFSQNAFLILGANIGSCVGVNVFSLNKNENAKKCANFNLFLNVFGALIFAPLIIIFPDFFQTFFEWLSPKSERQLANFHTLYNLFTSLAILPFLKFFVRLGEFKFKKPFRLKRKNKNN